MAERRSPGGQLGNTNAVRHGWRLLWRRAMVREQDRWVTRPVEAYIAGLRSDKPNPSAGEESCIEVAALAKGCSLLILNELKQHGLTTRIDGQLALTPVGEELRKFLELELKALKTLGLDRRAKPVGGSLQELLDQTTKEQRA